MAVTRTKDGRIEIVAVDTAIELLNWLTPWNTTWWRRGGADAWGFRGQRDEAWSLTPSAMRPKAFVRPDGSPRPVTTIDEQLKAEGDALAAFINICDRAALQLPDDGQWFRSPELITKLVGSPFGYPTTGGVHFPFPLLRSLFALAQHHGVPTRLLDWSKSGLTAAYFACQKVAKAQRPSGGRCAFWAVHQDAVEEVVRPDLRLVKVTAPFDTNPNLRAQRGLFSLVEYKTPPPDHHLPDLDAVLRNVAPPPGKPDVPLMYKITMPHSQCAFLMSLLNDANVNAATVFPGYDGAVEAVREQMFYPKTVPGSPP
jgi:hypothetical protein